MRNFICIFLLLFFSFCCANEDVQNWEDFWIKGVTLCSENSFNEGIEQFSEAIAILEDTADQTHDHTFVDRGRAYLLIDQTEAGVLDFQYALSRNNLDSQEKIRALVSIVIGLSRLNRLDECLVF